MNIETYCKSNGLTNIFNVLLVKARSIRDDEENKLAADFMKIPGMTVNPSFFGIAALTQKHFIKAIEEISNKKINEFNGAKWYEIFTSDIEAQIKNAIKEISKS